MSEFLKGMSIVGQLFPPPYPYENYPLPNSAWRGVADSFRQAGNDLKFALRENGNAERESKQTP